MSERLTLTGEYLFTDLGTENYTGQGGNVAPGQNLLSVNQDYKFNRIQIGLNYRF